MTKKSLKIFFIPIEMVGHTSAMMGLAQRLAARGHTVTIVVDESRVSLVTSPNITVAIVNNGFANSSISGEYESICYKKYMNLWERVESRTIFRWIWEYIKYKVREPHMIYSTAKRMVVKNEQLRHLIASHEPDLFVMDDFVGFQAILETNKPWVWYYSPNPLLLLNDSSLPPPFSGLPMGRSNWRWHWSRYLNGLYIDNPKNSFNLIAAAIGLPVRVRHMEPSPYLNIYCIPKELDYVCGKGSKGKNRFRVDSFITRDEMKSVGAFNLGEILHKFGYKPNEKKVIYVSMGSFCSANIQYMKRLIAVLAKSPHIFIVSKGYYHKEYELADNMWGESFLPQKQIMEVVDLVITHGGNNTVTEALTLGKPMIVIPLYMDQHDNAQRVHECGYGIRVNPSDEHRLLEAIEQLLNDEELKRRLNCMSERIAKEDRLTEAAQLVEQLHQGKCRAQEDDSNILLEKLFQIIF